MKQVVLVTGAAHGLGWEVARQLTAADRHVIIASRDAGQAGRAADALGEDAEALSVGLDLTDPASIEAAARAVRDSPGRLDGLVNNAAAFVDWTETATHADMDAAQQVIATNLLGTWRLIQALLPLLRQSLAPRIVNVSSGAGSHGDDTFGLRMRGGTAATYGISKAALNALTSTLAVELAGTPVLVNSVCPGLTATWPGAESMGARPPEESAPGVVWAATLPDGGPTGGFFRDARPLPW